MTFIASKPLWKGKHLNLVRDPESGWLTVDSAESTKYLHTPPMMPAGDWNTEHLGFFLYENWVQHINHSLQRRNPTMWAEIVEDLNQATLESLKLQEQG